ncbi:Protein PAIR1 [Glycine soja]|nr:Protein PAIR1 [Glycine soja]
MKINRACDLNSISVFPPPLIHRRKANNVTSGLQANHSQHRSQPSQQSLSQGISSQHGLLSHFSQNSLDEAVTTNDQRVGSQEHENSLRRMSSFSRPTYSREESQAPNSRSSSNLMLKWHSADHKSQLSEGLEHRIGIMETSLGRFTMILDSVQSDVMQVNKGTKEITLEVECIRKKLIAQDNSLQLMTKGQEEIKAIIEGSLKSLAEQMSHVSKKEKLREVYLAVSALPQLIEASLQNISCNLKSVNQKDLAPTTLSSKSITKQISTPKMRQPLANEAKVSIQATVAPEVEMGGWKPVKKERVPFSDRRKYDMVQKKKEPHIEKYIRGGRDCAIVIESDEDIDGGFSCLFQENSGEDLLGNLTKETEEETERILRKARRRKRKVF